MAYCRNALKFAKNSKIGLNLNAYRNIHVNRALNNIRITKNGEDIVTPIKTIDDWNLHPNHQWMINSRLLNS